MQKNRNTESRWGRFLSNLASGTSCHNGNGGKSCCSKSYKCKEGEGDCDDDNDCLGNLICGNDNCNQKLGFGSDYDCCYNLKEGQWLCGRKVLT